MRAFSEWSPSTDSFFSPRSVVAFDLDDTLTHDGALPAKVVDALERTQKAGWMTVMVTGRSAGWVDALIKLLPFDAIVGENGALLSYWPRGKAFRVEREEPRKMFWNAGTYGAAPPAGIREKHASATQTILSKYPKARVASDQAYRIYDLAIDFAEEVDPPLPLSDAEGIREVFESLGAVAKVSSIHVNGWWGAFSKDSGLRRLLEGEFGRTLEKSVIYVGDSPNDGPLFAAAGMSVGVANIQQFVGISKFTLPKFVASKKSSEGSLEILEKLIQHSPQDRLGGSRPGSR